MKTIGEATDLGSGFKIAMRDLEIRGAGNLLGESQSGHIAAVGYDLYCQMVTEAVGEMKGEPVEGAERDQARRAHRRVSCRPTTSPRRSRGSRPTAAWPAVTTSAEVDDIRTEWEDRYGPVPEPADALLNVGYLRAECHRLGCATSRSPSSQARLAPIELEDQRRDAPAASGAKRDLQGRLEAARRADPA